MAVLFLSATGGNLNPLVWGQQMERRVHPEILLEVEAETIAEIEQEFMFFEKNVQRGLEYPCFEEETIFHRVFCFVSRKIEYKDDIANYYGFDYLANAEEVLARGADDCDGKAVLSVIILRSRGYDAQLVLGIEHSWAEVRDGDMFVYLDRRDTKDPVTITSYSLGTGPGAYATVDGDSTSWHPAPFAVQALLIFSALFALVATIQLILAFGVYKGPLGVVTEMAGYLKYLIYMVLLVFGVWVLLLIVVRLLYERTL